jgi:hypothetical protein
MKKCLNKALGIIKCVQVKMSYHEVMSKIDNIKEKLTDNEYKEICDVLSAAHKKDLIKNKNKFKERIKEFEEKYFNLVWFARSDSMEPNIVAIREEVIEKYPEECEKICDEEEGNWAHGFNSGALATSRLFMSYFSDKEEITQAESDFPELDS